MAVTEAALLREVARVQRDKTIQDVRDAIEKIAVTQPRSGSRSWDSENRSAHVFKNDVLAQLQRIREED